MRRDFGVIQPNPKTFALFFLHFILKFSFPEKKENPGQVQAQSGQTLINRNKKLDKNLKKKKFWGICKKKNSLLSSSAKSIWNKWWEYKMIIILSQEKIEKMEKMGRVKNFGAKTPPEKIFSNFLMNY